MQVIFSKTLKTFALLILFLIFMATAHAQPGTNVHCTFALIKQKK